MIKKIKSVSEQILEVFEENKNLQQKQNVNREFIDFNNSIEEMLNKQMGHQEASALSSPIFSVDNT